MNKDKIIIYTDGSSLGNPGPGGWGAIVFHKSEIAELGGENKDTTNNRMELTATIKALEHLKNVDEEIILYTDSSYTINGITKWVEGWQANSWMKRDKTEVLNRGLWEELIVVTAGKNIAWKHVAGHSGVIGNERADYIATSFAEGKTPNLFRGSITEYGFDILDVSCDEKMKSARSKTRARSRAKAYSYLSLVGGIFSRHSTWAECEACVKGSKGAKYRKAISIEDEAIIKKEWGV